MWLRIEVDDDPSDWPFVVGTVAWDCAGASTIEDCQGVCQIGPFTDAGDPEDMFDQPGKSAFSVHHKSYYLDKFRAGSEPPQ